MKYLLKRRIRIGGRPVWRYVAQVNEMIQGTGGWTCRYTADPARAIRWDADPYGRPPDLCGHFHSDREQRWTPEHLAEPIPTQGRRG